MTFEDKVQVTMEFMRYQIRKTGRVVNDDFLRPLAEKLVRDNPNGITEVTDPEQIAKLNRIAFGKELT